LLFSTYAMQLVAWTLMMFFIAGLCRMFYAGLFLGMPVSPKIGLAYIGKTWWKLLILFLGQMVAYIGFVVADVVLIFVGGLAAFVLLMALMWLVTTVFNEAGLAVFSSGLRGLLVIGAMLVTFVIMMALITFQVMLLTFPLVAVAVSDGVGFFSQAFYGIQLAFANMRKVMLYSLSSLFVFMCISMALHLPVWLWLVVELGLAAMDNVKTAPDHVLAAYTLWGSLVFGFLVPAWMAGVTLLYYDCQACKEGLDLRRLFERMRVRRKIAV
ncbi:MAG: hypothetical protein KTR14_03435, partial [Vampirovibrio sp.]|nr:hypothetical protein [Vampirovibrio sp.]